MCYGSVFLTTITTELHLQLSRLCGNAGRIIGPNYNIGYELRTKYAHRYFSLVNQAYHGNHLTTLCKMNPFAAAISSYAV